MKARTLAAIAALLFLAIPALIPEGWAPLAACVPAALLAAFAVIGAD